MRERWMPTTKKMQREKKRKDSEMSSILSWTRFLEISAMSLPASDMLELAKTGEFLETLTV